MDNIPYTRTLEPPQVTSIDRYEDGAYLAFSYEGSQAAAEAAIRAAYPSAKVWPNTMDTEVQIYVEALGNTWVGDYVGEPKDREVYYRRKDAKRKAGTEALRRLRNL